ncbi:LOW QUALITY PROTEIN: transcription factor HES-4 [Talpa occidentalis]|uniref:LOW QUALITY PROTEIN: transcription factor HES-4 n=1 Tax=Talpa occidentalis TaxID=50954 RepID=UPI00188F5868|nr:LOW QUALITY PROTEIN: transcription factor HES-4 [Talpa occidentalis]
MPADAPGKPRASPPAGAPASARRSARPPRSAAEHRKSSKPVMEKRRRARINESLGQLKTLLLDALRKDSSRHSKLEKADILEMTVRHLQSLRRVRVAAALAADPAVLGQYRAGFRECLAEVRRFLAGCEPSPPTCAPRLSATLAACLGQLQPSRRAPRARAAAAQAPAPGGPGTVSARPLPPGPSRAPAAARGAGPQGQGAPWRPWLR